MNLRQLIMALLFAVLGVGGATAHPVLVPHLYVFGFAASFNDSTVFITEVQQVDSAWIESKGKFLYNRGEYAGQLRTYLRTLGKEDETCVVFFATSEKEILKQYVKLRKTYEQPKKKDLKERGRFLVTNVRKESFQFHALPQNFMTVPDSKAAKRAEKAARKAAKEKKKGKKPHSIPADDTPQQVMTIGEDKAS